eukprot:11770188-Alexandrium_andersonii.AAC.1
MGRTKWGISAGPPYLSVGAAGTSPTLALELSIGSQLRALFATLVLDVCSGMILCQRSSSDLVVLTVPDVSEAPRSPPNLSGAVPNPPDAAGLHGTCQNSLEPSGALCWNNRRNKCCRSSRSRRNNTNNKSIHSNQSRKRRMGQQQQQEQQE